MHFILFCITIGVIWTYRNNILEALYSRFRSSRVDGNNALTFTLSALLSGLTDRERIIFRDSVDRLYRSLKKIKGYRTKVDVRNIDSLLHRAQGKSVFTSQEYEVFEKAFKIITDAAKNAPANLESELTVEQIYIFLKDNI